MSESHNPGNPEVMADRSPEKKKIRFIVNPIAGAKGKERILSLIERHLDRDKYIYEVARTGYAGHATALARECDADIVCAIGGDGTLNEVAACLLGTGKVFALIPCGSGDGLALHLGISRRPLGAIRNLNRGHVEAIDSGLIDGKPFFSISGVGLDAIVSHRFAQAPGRGLRTYVSEALKTWRGFRPERYTIRADDAVWSGPAALVSVGNSNQWGNQARITSTASVTDGLLDVTVVTPFRTRHIPGLVLKLMTGNMHRSRHAVCLRGAEIILEREAEGPAHFDGDPFVLGTRIGWEAVPHSLRMIVPPGKK